MTTYICKQADLAIEAGCEGVIASGESVKALRQHLGSKPIIVVPGVRPSGSSTDDHKRTLTPAKAIEYGADYLVVGRPIRNAPDPAKAAEAIVMEMAEAIQAKESR
jgi:orotidine-5'-phosphate decarboxylase